MFPQEKGGSPKSGRMFGACEFGTDAGRLGFAFRVKGDCCDSAQQGPIRRCLLRTIPQILMMWFSIAVLPG